MPPLTSVLLPRSLDPSAYSITPLSPQPSLLSQSLCQSTEPMSHESLMLFSSHLGLWVKLQSCPPTSFLELQFQEGMYLPSGIGTMLFGNVSPRRTAHIASLWMVQGTRISMKGTIHCYLGTQDGLTISWDGRVVHHCTSEVTAGDAYSYYMAATKHHRPGRY